jgi:hypothetical protein
MRHLVIDSRFEFLHRPSQRASMGWLFPLFATLVILGFMFGCVPTAQADSQARAVRLSSVDGSVQLMTGSETAFEQAYPNMPLTQGMRLQTGGDGRAEIQFEDGSVARVTPNSSILLTKLARANDGTTMTQIELQAGLAYFELDGAHGQYTVTLGPDQITAAKGASFRVNRDANPASVAVLHGTVHVEGGSAAPVDAEQNATLSVDLNNPSQFQVAQGVEADSWDQWNRDRDKALQQMTMAESPAHQGYGNAGDPAWSSLDYYGNWYNLPGYGMVWTPAGAGSGFDPFGNGMWGYYPGWGYTWISGYNWGWLPYHCGAWNYFDTMGWGWMPGDCGYGYGYGYGGWSPVVPIWNAPGHYVPPVRPRLGDPRGHLPGSGGRLIAVNRGSGPVWSGTGVKPEPRPVNFHGNPISPVVTSVHTSPVTRPGMGGASGFRPGENIPARPVYSGGIGVAPRGVGSHVTTGTRQPGGSPTFHAPSGGGAPHVSGGGVPHISSGGGGPHVSSGGSFGGGGGHASSGGMSSGGGGHVSSGSVGGGGGGGHVK